MRLVKNYINEKFTLDSDPIQDMGIGIPALFDKWINDRHYTWSESYKKRHPELNEVIFLNLMRSNTPHKYDFMELMLKQGVNPDGNHLTDPVGDFLKIAIDNNDIKAIRLLLKYKANPNIIIYYLDRSKGSKEIKDIIRKAVKKYNQKHIDEKFTLDSDPIQDMGIGSLHYYEKRSHEVGSTSYREMHKKYFSDYPTTYDYRDIGWILYIFLFYFCEEKLDIKLTLDKLFKEEKSRMQSNIKECMHIISDTLKKQFYLDIDPYLETYLEHISESVNEKFSENGDPIDNMDIGIKSLLKKKYIEMGHMSEAEIYDLYFRPFMIKEWTALGMVLYLILKYISEKDLPFQDAFENALFNLNYHRREPKILKAVREKMADVLEKHFRINVNPDIINFVNEKFTEESDPISDMGIGIIHEIKLLMKSTGEPFKDKDLALIYCAKYGKLDFVEYLLATGADVHAYDDTALRRTSSNGHTEVVKVLLAAGADVHASDNLALKWASNKGHTEVVKVLLAAGADIHAENDHALRYASDNGRAEVVKLLLAAGANVHTGDDWSLRWASHNGHAEVVKVLLAAGANVHVNNDYALRWASYYGHPEVVKVLLAAGANVHADNDAALRWAIKNRQPKVIKILKDHIAKEKRNKVKESVNEKFTEDTDAIHDMGIGMDHLIKKWIEDELYMDYKAQKEYLLSICVVHNKFDFVKYLVEQGVNVKSKHGSDALQTAASYGYLDIVKYLLDKGADPTANDNFALRWAARNGHYEIVKILIDAGADPHAKGNYALRMARIYGNKNVIKLLQKYSSDQNNIVKESINEKFTEDSDPIYDLGIGGISFEEKRKETIGAEYIKSSEWLDYINSFIGKTITGDFGQKGIRTFKICHTESYSRGTRLNFYDEDNNLYLVQPDKRYIIR